MTLSSLEDSLEELAKVCFRHKVPKEEAKENLSKMWDSILGELYD